MFCAYQAAGGDAEWYKRKKVVTTVSTTMITLYLAGALLTVAAVLEIAPRFDHGHSVPHRNGYAIIGGALWPILLVGLIQFGCVMAFANRVRNSAVENELRLVRH